MTEDSNTGWRTVAWARRSTAHPRDKTWQRRHVVTIIEDTDLTNHAGGDCDDSEIQAAPERLVLSHLMPSLAHWEEREWGNVILLEFLVTLYLLHI